MRMSPAAMSMPCRSNLRTPWAFHSVYAVGAALIICQFDQKVAAIMVSLRDRMRFYKLRVAQNTASIASIFNKDFQPETIPETNDPFRVEWIQGDVEDDVLVGDKVHSKSLSHPRWLMGILYRLCVYQIHLSRALLCGGPSTAAGSTPETILRPR